MKLEYLFTDKNKSEEIKGYDLSKYNSKDKNTSTDNEEKVLKDIVKLSAYDIPKTDAWILSFITDYNNEDNAKNLSAINSNFVKRYSPTILTDEASEYFNRRLYPLANTFERKLRKLLYLMAAMHKDSDAANNIKDLERMDFGTIYRILFTDSDFVKNTKNQVKKASNFSRVELIRHIEAIPENTEWVQLAGEDLVPALDEHFLDIKEYRNDIMHAHNMSYEQFQQEKKTLEVANTDLQNAIDSILDDKASIPKEFNENLSEVLKKSIPDTLGSALATLAIATKIATDGIDFGTLAKGLSIFAQLAEKIALAPPEDSESSKKSDEEGLRPREE